VNYNTASVLKECIESVFKYEDSNFFEIIIADNNSKDNSEEIIRYFENNYSNVKSIYLKTLESFSHSNNRAYELSSGEYILIMNPDIIFIQPVLKKLTENIQADNRIGAISLMLTGTDNRFQREYFQRYPSVIEFVLFLSVLMKFFYRFPGLMNRYLENQDIEKSPDEIVFVEQIPGAFFLTPRKIFTEAGEMDEKFKLFFEDMDLSYQIGKKYKVAVNTKLKITHLGGTSFQSDENWWLYSRYIMSMNHFFDKNYNFFRRLGLKIASVSNSLFIVLVEIVKKVLGTQNKYRFKKHKHFLKEFFEHYF
jgi:GT2 family glycosyltransferase